MIGKIAALFLLGVATQGAVTISEYYDNRVIPVMSSSDDMWNGSHDATRWDRMWEAAEFGRSNHLVMTSGLVVGRMTNTYSNNGSTGV